MTITIVYPLKLERKDGQIRVVDYDAKLLFLASGFDAANDEDVAAVQRLVDVLNRSQSGGRYGS